MRFGSAFYRASAFYRPPLCAGLAYSVVAAVFVILQGRLSIFAYLPSLLIDFAVAALLTAVLCGVWLGFAFPGARLKLWEKSGHEDCRA